MEEEKQQKQSTDEVDIHIHFKKVNAKTALVFLIGCVIIFCLTESTQLKIGIVILGILFLLGSLCGGSSKETVEDKKNEGESDAEQKPAVSEPVKKNIRKPKVPEQQKANAPAPEPKVETKEEDMTRDDWSDFFASLDNNEEST